jgi:cell envelope opacity-associated protein A
LRSHVIACARILERKISDAGPTNQRIDPHILTEARKEPAEKGSILEIRRVASRGITSPRRMWKPAMPGVFEETVRTRTPSLTPKYSASCGVRVSPSNPTARYCP